MRVLILINRYLSKKACSKNKQEIRCVRFFWCAHFHFRPFFVYSKEEQAHLRRTTFCFSFRSFFLYSAYLTLNEYNVKIVLKQRFDLNALVSHNMWAATVQIYKSPMCIEYNEKTAFIMILWSR